MDENYFNKINGSIVIYFGFSFILGSVACLIGTIVMAVKNISNGGEFSFSIIFTLILIALFTGVIGYLLYKAGIENLKK